MQTQEYWNTIGSKKEFEDPLYLDKLSPFLTPKARIVEYGCGYGRLMEIFWKAGYRNLIGLDFAESMIERGRTAHPHLNLRLLQESGKIPCHSESVDAVVMSTVLCCLISPDDKAKLLLEIWRVLKEGGVLYLSDFLICNDARYHEKYAEGFKKFGAWGIYKTSENLVVQHMTTKGVMDLLGLFDIQWFEQFDFKTMNQNPARTFHCIAKK